MAECGACAGTLFDNFFHARERSTSGRYLSDPATRLQPVTIALECCRSCGFIRQTSGQVVRLDYQKIARGTATQLPVYAGRIIASLTAFGIGPDDLVVEVGANDGTFLAQLRTAGFRNLIGVEPSKHLADMAAAAGFEILNTYFDRPRAAALLAARGPARAVICRHTLEHVPEIRELTRGIAALLGPDGISFIEVPDTDWVITELFAHEIWDEHISYFRPCSLARLLVSSGLTPVRLERARFRDTRNLLCWSVHEPASITGPVVGANDDASAADVAGFQRRWDAFSARLRAVVAAAPKPIIGIGAAHIQLNFLNFTGLDSAVDVLIDDDPAKAGRFAPLARPTPIRSTAEILAQTRQGTLLCTAFPYPDWERTLRDALRPHGVGAIEPYGSLTGR